jgi:hypothetical protein
MRKLEEQINRTLTTGMHMPAPLGLLFAWIEENDFYVDRAGGERVGFLFPESELRSGWTDSERPGGTNIEFFAEGNRSLGNWFGHERPEILGRLCVFAKTGAEGSMAAFWLDPFGQQKIVHLGSGSGSIMVCVLASDPIDFLRLLAVGYDEICWGNEFSVSPNLGKDRSLFVHPNTRYQEWVRTTFSVEIPITGSQVVLHPDNLGDLSSTDPFNIWVSQNVA